MTKGKVVIKLTAFFVWSFFILNLGFSLYFLSTHDKIFNFQSEEKVNHSADLRTYFPDINDLVVNEISSTRFAIKGVIKNNETIYNIINYFLDNKVEIETLIIEPVEFSQRLMNIKLVLKR